MSKFLRKIGKVLVKPAKDKKIECDTIGDELEVDAVPTEKAVIPRLGDEDHGEVSDATPVQGQQSVSQTSNQANQFNGPNQTVYQFNHANGIHIGNNFTINQNINQERVSEDKLYESDDQRTAGCSNGQKDTGDTSEKKRLRKKYPKTRTIELLLNSKEDIDHRAMDVIATHLGEDWRSVARDLGFSNGEIDHFWEDNFAYGVKEVIYKILTEWSQREEEPHIGRVCQILWTRDIHREVVDELRKDYKRRQQEK